MEILRCENVTKIYDNGETQLKALDNVSLSVEKGEFVAIVGVSGSGKSTLLHIIGTVDKATSGKVYIDGKDITNLSKERSAIFRRRKVGLIYQFYNLIPTLTVEQNILLPLRLDKKAFNESYLYEIASTLGLLDKLGNYPNQLSGGQQQRIALARALVISPDVLLMDEPLSNLDAKLRVEMRSVIRHTQKSVGITTVYVTHDQEEAMAISDRIAVMKDGVIQHVGTPRDIYQRPKNVFVATFIGRTNIVNAHVKDGIITFADGYHEHIDALDKAAEQDVRCSIRPEEFIICKDGTDGIHGTVQECTYLGLNTHYTIDTDQGDSVEIVEESSIGEGLKKGEKVLLKVKKEKINVFTKDGGTNLIRSDAYEKQ